MENNLGDHNDLQNGVFCILCKSKNDIDANFCESCGATLRTVLICQRCKAENDDQAKYCDQCGNQMYTPEYHSEQRLKLWVGLISLGVCFLLWVYAVIADYRKGTRWLSTRDGMFGKEVKEMNKWLVTPPTYKTSLSTYDILSEVKLVESKSSGSNDDQPNR